MKAEYFSQQTRLAGHDDESRQLYKKALTDFYATNYHAQYPPESGWGVISARQASANNTAIRHNQYDPSTQAAMWTMAIKSRGDQNALIDEDVDAGKDLRLSQIWKNTTLETLAAECEEALDGLSPNISNTVTQIDLDAMKRHRLSEIKFSHKKEVFVFLGLNGAGKDFLIGYLTKFLEVCDMPNEIIKMPNPDGVLFNSINGFLHGEIKLTPNAAQLLMLSDASNTEVSSGKLSIMNRHPMFDAMVFGSNELQPTVLSAHPLFNIVTHTFVVDRLPSIALDSVKSRPTEPRIFEQKVDQMIDLRERYASLTKLPGVRFMTMDFDEPNLKDQVISSVHRLYHYIRLTGVIQRILIRSGQIKNYAGANQFLHDKYGEFRTRYNLWHDK